MGTKSGITLDMAGMCNMIREANRYANNTLDKVSSITAIVKQFEDDNILSGNSETASTIRESLTQIGTTCNNLASVAQQIRDVANKQMNQMAVACTANPSLKGALDLINKTKAEIAAMDANQAAKSGSKKN